MSSKDQNVKKTNHIKKGKVYSFAECEFEASTVRQDDQVENGCILGSLFFDLWLLLIRC